MTRNRGLLIVAGLVALLVSAALFLGSTMQNGSSSDELASEAVVTASSSAPGYSARPIVRSGSAASTAEWRSAGQTIGAWVELHWASPRSLHSVEIRRGALPSAGVDGGVLQFGDGSALQVTFPDRSRRAEVVFPTREVQSLRFVVTQVAAGSSSVALSAFHLNGSNAIAENTHREIAGAATITASSGTSPAGLVDGRGWRTADPTGSSITFAWPQWREVVAVEIAGASSPSSISSANVSFGGGGTVRVGGVQNDAALPTKVAFLPRSVRTLTLTISAVSGSGVLDLSRVRIWERGSRAPAEAPMANGSTVTDPVAGTCPDSAPSSGFDRLRVLCPTNGSRVGDEADLSVGVPNGATGVRAEVWPSTGTATVPPVQVQGSGVVRLPLRLGPLPDGPVTVALTPLGGVGEGTGVHLQLLHGQSSVKRQPTSVAADGRTLVWDEEFDGPVSVSREQPDYRYAAGKPERTYYADFGDAIFADPSDGFDNIGTLDNRYLQLSVSPKPDDVADPQGWNRTRIGGMLASSHPGGAGFSAQYGYFEARMLVPANPGTWPAFWMLPSTSLISEQKPIAEVDAVELYGHDPTGACHTTHSYGSTDGGGIARCGQRFDSERVASQWHTYGVSIEPSVVRYFIDGNEVARAPQVAGGSDPMFFLVNLALGGGWPIDLAGTGDRAQMLVDYVRVYV